MTISVVMATRNGERWIGEQLDSIEQQVRSPDEIVIVDDASQDSTLRIVEERTARWTLPVRVIRQETQTGSTLAFSRGIKAAKSSIIVLADQDDIWERQKLERLGDTMRGRSEVGLAFSDAWILDGSRARRSRLWDVAGFSVHQQRTMRHEGFGQILSRSIVSGCTLAFRSTLRPVVLPFPVEITDPLGPMTHDRWISIVASACAPVEVIAEPLIGYRIHADQQIGIPRLQVRRVVPSSAFRYRQFAVPRSDTQARLAYYIEHLRELRTRVLDTGIGGGAAIEKVDDALAHLVRRRDLSLARPARVPAVARDVVNGRYHRYSLGLASAIADVVR